MPSRRPRPAIPDLLATVRRRFAPLMTDTAAATVLVSDILEAYDAAYAAAIEATGRAGFDSNICLISSTHVRRSRTPRPAGPSRSGRRARPTGKRTAVAYLFDCCPPDFRGYPVLRGHPPCSRASRLCSWRLSRRPPSVDWPRPGRSCAGVDQRVIGGGRRLVGAGGAARPDPAGPVGLVEEACLVGVFVPRLADRDGSHERGHSARPAVSMTDVNSGPCALPRPGCWTRSTSRPTSAG